LGEIMVDSADETNLDKVRRDCFVLSIAILLLSISGAQFTKLELPWTEVTFNNPWVLYVFFWLVWIYFHMRFFQIYTEIYRKDGPSSRRRVKNAWRNSIDNNSFKWPIKLLYAEDKKPEELAIIIHSGFSKIRCSIDWIDPTSGANTRLHEMVEVRMISKRMILPFIVALIKFTINQSAFLEYLLPIIVGIVAFISGNIMCWDGNLIGLIKIGCKHFSHLHTISTNIIGQ
jgi:hypothetical protein